MLSKYYFFRSCLTVWTIFLSMLCQGQVAEVKDKLGPALSVKLSGFIEQRLNAAYNHRILSQDANRLVDPFRNRTETRCWQSEFWGKWFTSAVLAYRYRPDIVLKKKLNAAIEQLIATQTSDGYIGNYAPAARLEQWDIWGRHYCLLGLLAYYQSAGGSPKAGRSSYRGTERKECFNCQKRQSPGYGFIVCAGTHLSFV